MTAAGVPVPGRPALEHMAQLDGLRALAVAAVAFHHFGLQYFAAPSPSAAAGGVRLFFVLSGFLITGILLAARDNVTAGRSSTSTALKHFYLRRMLRIFPIYYLVVFITVIANVDPAREYAWWLLTYTLNLKMAAQGYFINTFPHFWSLNVEEQFYIVWPWVVLLLPSRWLIPAALAMIVTTPLGKIAYILSDYTMTSGIGTYVSTWANLDTLGAGALLALLRHQHSSLAQPHGRPALVCAIAGGLVLLLISIWPGEARNVCESTAEAALFAWLILRASVGFTGPLGAALRWKPAAFVGKISYGIYVYHLFVPGLLASALARSGTTGTPSPWTMVAAAVTGTLLLSALSWFLMERPINRLKERFSEGPALRA